MYTHNVHPVYTPHQAHQLICVIHVGFQAAGEKHRQYKWLLLLISDYHTATHELTQLVYKYSYNNQATDKEQNKKLTNCFFNCISNFPFSFLSAAIARGSYTKSRTINLSSVQKHNTFSFPSTLRQGHNINARPCITLRRACDSHQTMFLVTQNTRMQCKGSPE